MARKRPTDHGDAPPPRRPARATPVAPPTLAARPSALLDTRIIYSGDCLDQLRKLPNACIDLIYIDPPFSSNCNYLVFRGETREKRAFEDRHTSTAAYIDYTRPRCVELARDPKKSGSSTTRATGACRTTARPEWYI